jgi:hypothetical protein
MLFNQLPVHIFEATSLRTAGFEDEDEDDFDAPFQGAGLNRPTS